MALSPSSLSSSSSLRLLTRASGISLNPRARRGLEPDSLLTEAVRRRPSGGRDTWNLDKDLDKGDRQGNLQFDSADLHSELHASKGVMHDPDFFRFFDVFKDVMHDPDFFEFFVAFEEFLQDLNCFSNAFAFSQNKLFSNGPLQRRVSRTVAGASVSKAYVGTRRPYRW